MSLEKPGLPQIGLSQQFTGKEFFVKTYEVKKKKAAPAAAPASPPPPPPKK